MANARVQLDDLRGGFDREIADFEQVADLVRARAVDSGETLRAQAEELSATAARIADNMEKIRGTGRDEALAIDQASERATGSLRELIESMRGQIDAIESSFQQAVENTVGRVSSAGNSASEDIRAAADIVVAQTRDVVEAVRVQTDVASTAIGEAGAQIAGEISRSPDSMLANARAVGDELERRAAEVAEGFEAAMARAGERLAELSNDAGARSEEVSRELSARMEETGRDFERLAQAVSARVADVSAQAAQRARKPPRPASPRRRRRWKARSRGRARKPTQ